MEEIREALGRLRAYGETLRSGAPHQIPVGNDIMAVCEHAEHADRAGEPGKPLDADAISGESAKELIERNVSLRDQLDTLKLNVDGIMGDRDSARADAERLTKERDEAREDTARLTSELDRRTTERDKALADLAPRPETSGAGQTDLDLKK